MNAQHLTGCSKIHTLPEELLLCFCLFTTGIPIKAHGSIVYVLSSEILIPNPQRYLTHWKQCLAILRNVTLSQEYFQIQESDCKEKYVKYFC